MLWVERAELVDTAIPLRQNLKPLPQRAQSFTEKNTEEKQKTGATAAKKNRISPWRSPVKLCALCGKDFRSATTLPAPSQRMPFPFRNSASPRQFPKLL